MNRSNSTSGESGRRGAAVEAIEAAPRRDAGGEKENEVENEATWAYGSKRDVVAEGRRRRRRRRYMVYRLGWFAGQASRNH
jgi:hypothetical protein